MTNREIVEDIKSKNGMCLKYSCHECPLYAMTDGGCIDDDESLKYANKWLANNPIRESFWKTMSINMPFIDGLQSIVPHEIKAMGKNLFDPLKLMHEIFNNKGEIMKFKVGDRVVVNCKYGAIEAGEKATFVEYDKLVGTDSNEGMPFVNIKTDKGQVLNMYEFRIDLLTEEDGVVKFKVGDRVEYTNKKKGCGFAGNVGDTGVIESAYEKIIRVKRDDTGYLEIKSSLNIKLIPSYITTEIKEFPEWLKSIPRDKTVKCWISDTVEVPDGVTNLCITNIHSFIDGFFVDVDGDTWNYATPIPTPVVNPQKIIAEKALVEAQKMVVRAQEALEALK